MDPWKTWLTDSTLVGPVNGIAILKVSPSLEDVAKSLEFCTEVYGTVKSLHPDLVSLVVTVNGIYKMVADGELVLTDVKVIHG